MTDEQSEQLAWEAEALADRAISVTSEEAGDLPGERLVAAEEYVKEFARNNGTPREVEKLALEYLKVSEHEGWI